MSFIRIKRIKGKEYAYLVENKWRKRLKNGRKGSRQKVSKYLGRVLEFEKEKALGFFEFINVKENSDYLSKNKSRIIEDLVKYELFLRGFAEKGGIFEKSKIRFDVKRKEFVDADGKEQKLVIEMNEGFLCYYTINEVLRFRKRHEDDHLNGIELAKSFLEAGLNIPKEVFVGYFEKI